MFAPSSLTFLLSLGKPDIGRKLTKNGLPLISLPFTRMYRSHSPGYAVGKDVVYLPLLSSTTLTLMGVSGMGDLGWRKASTLSPPLLHWMFSLSNVVTVNVTGSEPCQWTLSGLGSTVQLAGQAPDSTTPKSSITFKRTAWLVGSKVTPETLCSQALPDTILMSEQTGVFGPHPY